MRNDIARKLSVILIVAGVLCIAGALGLFVFNKLEDKKAGDAVEIVLPDLEAQIFNNMMLNNGGNAQ